MTPVRTQILTITVNPALDHTIAVKDLESNFEYQKIKESYCAGGKGLNVARALKHLKSPTLNLTLLGGTTGRRIREALDSEKLNVISASHQSNTRVQLSITQADGQLLQRVVDPGARISLNERSGFEKKFMSLLHKVNTVVLSGSLPPGFPMSWYAQWIRTARKAGVSVFLDTRGPFLKQGLKARPHWIKPNQAEAEDVLGCRIRTDKQVKKALQEFFKNGVASPFISLGEKGLAGWMNGRCYRSELVMGNTTLKGYSVGCGDACVAGLVFSALRQRGPEETMRWATACGAENLRTPIPGEISKRLVEKNLKHVKVWTV